MKPCPPTIGRGGRYVAPGARCLHRSVRARAVTRLRHVFWLRFGLRCKMSRKQYLQPRTWSPHKKGTRKYRNQGCKYCFRLILNLSPNLSQKTWRNPVTRALGHYGAGSALQEPHTARPDRLSVGMASTNPRGGSMGLQGPPCAVLSPLVADPQTHRETPNQAESSL